MSLSASNLDAFFACAQTGSFTKAAEKLHITQSALSQRIQNLEGELETALFIRERSGARLTEAGQELLRYCQAKDALESEVVGRIRFSGGSELAGFVRIGGFSSVVRSVIMPAIAPLLAKHPKLRLQILSRELDELPELMKRGEIDYMVIDREIEREDLVACSIGEERNALVSKKGYDGPEIYLDHHESDEVTFRYLRLSNKKQTKLERRYLDDVYGLIEGVKLGLGKAVLPLHLVKKETGLLVDETRVLKIPVVLHYYDQPFYTRLHHEIVKALVENGRAALD